MESFTNFCKVHNLPKTSVWNWCQENGVNTSEGIDTADKDRILDQFGSHVEQSPSGHPEQSPSGHVNSHPEQSLAVTAGVSRGCPSLPVTGGGTLDVGQFTAGTEIYAFDDPMAFVEDIDLILGAATQGMNQHLDTLAQQLSRTTQARKVVVEKRKKFQAAAQRFQLLNEVRTQLLNTETANLQVELQEIQELKG